MGTQRLLLCPLELTEGPRTGGNLLLELMGSVETFQLSETRDAVIVLKAAEWLKGQGLVLEFLGSDPGLVIYWL